MPARSGGWRTAATVLLVPVLFGGCNHEQEAPPTEAPPAPLPSPSPPPRPAPQLPAPQAPSPAPQPEEPSAVGYPLTQAQAYAYVEAGIAVAGHVAGGYEVLVLQTTETTYEDQPVQEQVCEPEYDAYQEKYVTKCRYKTRYERRPVTKKVYIVSGFGGRRQYRNTAGAMSDAITRGASAFRRV